MSNTTTTNDVRRFVYSWFTMWEHRVHAERLTRHLAEDSLSLTFPGGSPLTSPAEFGEWYAGLLANTVWNFHELSNIEVTATGDGFDVSMDISWRGQTEASSEWPTTLPDSGFRFEVHQDWKVVTLEGDPLADPFAIVTLVASMA